MFFTVLGFLGSFELYCCYAIEMTDNRLLKKSDRLFVLGNKSWLANTIFSFLKLLNLNPSFRNILFFQGITWEDRLLQSNPRRQIDEDYSLQPFSEFLFFIKHCYKHTQKHEKIYEFNLTSACLFN